MARLRFRRAVGSLAGGENLAARKNHVLVDVDDDADNMAAYHRSEQALDSVLVDRRGFHPRDNRRRSLQGSAALQRLALQ